MVDDQKDGPGKSAESSKAIKVWQSAELFGEAKLVQIEHHGEVYQLRITRQGKLILNK
ncbi:MAG: hemin uptake protein HemP [Pirellulaceae bacterium]